MTRLRVVVVSNERVATRMAGPAIRSWQFARELGKRHDVTLAIPNEPEFGAGDARVVQAPVADDEAIAHVLRNADAVVAQRLSVARMVRLARSRVNAVYDLYAPTVLENLALDADRTTTPLRRTILHTNALHEQVVLHTGNAFVCASERQRDAWLGGLAAIGRLDHAEYDRDPNLRDLVDVVPFGLEPDPPRPGPAAKGVIRGIGPNDTLLLWPGGIWNWFDPLTVIRAVARIAEKRPDVRLLFLGTRHPDPAIEEMEMAARAVELSERMGLLDRIVFFNDGWVDYADRGRFLLDADVAVSAHFDSVETRFAFRTRLLDCFWATLPIVATGGDELGDRAAARGGAVTVRPLDDAAFARALETVLRDERRRARMREALGSLRDELVWPIVTQPLVRLVERPGQPVRTSGALLAAGHHLAARARWSLEIRGASGFVGNRLAKLRGRG